jgi:hypothetical protein
LLTQAAGEKKEETMSVRKNVRKRKRVAPGSPSLARELVVVLEEVRSQFKVFGEALQGVNENVDRLDRTVTSGFGRVDREMAAGFGRLDRELGLVKEVVLDHGRQLREIRGSVTRLEAAMEKKVDRDEVEAIVDRSRAR